MRHTAFFVMIFGVGVLSLTGCEREEPTFKDAGSRLDAAIRRVEDAKTELAAAEEELRQARAALDQKVETAPENAADVPVVPPGPGVR